MDIVTYSYVIPCYMKNRIKEQLIILKYSNRNMY